MRHERLATEGTVKFTAADKRKSSFENIEYPNFKSWTRPGERPVGGAGPGDWRRARGLSLVDGGAATCEGHGKLGVVMLFLWPT